MKTKRDNTVDSCYNGVLGTGKMLVIVKPCYIRVTQTIQYKGNLGPQKLPYYNSYISYYNSFISAPGNKSPLCKKKLNAQRIHINHYHSNLNAYE